MSGVATHARPILFSGAMVRALLAGTKTQTRRAIKPQPPAEARDAGVIISGTDSNGTWSWLDSSDLDEASFLGKDFRCPYGVPGDLLWVRETFRRALAVKAFYRASHEKLLADDGWTGPWTPAIHMPREFSRITLRITDVRVERLQDIREEDAWSEGVQDYMGKETPWKGRLAPVSVHAYATLWESINGPGSWAANPWVWCLCFERVDDAKAAA